MQRRYVERDAYVAQQLVNKGMCARTQREGKTYFKQATYRVPNEQSLTLCLLEQIMAKMNNAIENADLIKADSMAGKVVVNEKNKEMFDISSKLHNATENATRKMLTEPPQKVLLLLSNRIRLVWEITLLKWNVKIWPQNIQNILQHSQNGKTIHTLVLYLKVQWQCLRAM